MHLPENLQESRSTIDAGCEFENWAAQPENSAQQAKPKKNRKGQSKGEEKTVTCAYEEQNSHGDKNRRSYILTVSDPQNIAENAAKSKFQPVAAFKLNMQALKLKQTAKIDRLIAVDAIRTKLVPYNFQLKPRCKSSTR